MASTYSQNLKIELIGTGDQVNSWGLTTNDNLGVALEEAIVGYGNPIFTNDANLTLTLANSNASQVARKYFLEVTSSVVLSVTRDLIIPAIEKSYLVHNNTTGGQGITVKNVTGSGVTVPNGKKMLVYNDGADVFQALDHFSSLSAESPAFTGTPTAPTAANGTNTNQLATTAFVLANQTPLATILNTIYPVGSIYINATNNTNPGTLLGFGTWVAFGAGRVPVGFDASDPLFDSAEETGGSKDAIVVSHTHTFSGTTGSAGAHSHTLSGFGKDGSTFNWPDLQGRGYFQTTSNGVNSAGEHTHTVSGTTASAGSSGTNANLQPYITVFMWKRTA